MRPSHFSAIAALVLTATLAVPNLLDAQGVRTRIQERARQQAEARAEQRAAEVVGRALDTAEEGIRCVFTDADCIARAESDGQIVIYTDPEGNRTDAQGTPMPVSGIHDPAWSNYDFVPGDRVIFYDDFENDRIGNFPRRLEFESGNMEVALWQDRRFLRVTSRALFRVPLPETLPDRFSLEFEVHQTHASNSLVLATATVRPPHMLGAHSGSAIRVDRTATGVKAYGGTGGEALASADRIMEAVPHIRVMGDGRYVKVYVDEHRVANVPNAVLERSREINFIVEWAGPDGPVYIGPIRVAAGGEPIYDALMDDGRLVTHGILFGIGAADIRPESRQTLIQIAEALQRNLDLRLRIEGHTDSTGDAAANQALSERRATAVMEHLVSVFAIDARRLEAVGMGQSAPLDSNDSPEGRQNNRRVELVRL
jgi:OmpA-OmpF porin, OOP family